MKKILIASVSAIGLMGLAACTDVDDTTTQGMEPMQDDLGAPETGAVPPPAEEPIAPID